MSESLSKILTCYLIQLYFINLCNLFISLDPKLVEDIEGYSSLFLKFFHPKELVEIASLDAVNITVSLHKICQSTGFCLQIFSLIRVESTILSLYGKTMLGKNPYSGTFYIVHAFLFCFFSWWDNFIPYCKKMEGMRSHRSIDHICWFGNVVSWKCIGP